MNLLVIYHIICIVNIVFTNEAMGMYTHNVLYVNEILSNLGSTVCKFCLCTLIVTLGHKPPMISL